MSNCSKCGSCEDCDCVPNGLTTPNYCPSDLPPCPQPSPCNETFDSKCVIYTGDNLPCLDITKGDTVEEVILALNDKLSAFFCLDCASLVVPANASTAVPYNQVLTWNMVTGATNYDVYLGTDSTMLPLVSAGQILTSYTPTAPLLPDTTYYWKVVPKNGSGSAQDCPVYSFSTVALSCVNPLSHMLDYVVGLQAGSTIDAATLVNDITGYLQAGELITNCNFCCPDCKQTSRYVLASAPVYANYYSSFYSLPNCPPVCCTEVDASLSAMNTGTMISPTTLSQAFALVPPVTNCCGTGFSECSQQLKQTLGTAKNQVYQVNGVVEESTISNSTELCVLSAFLNSYPFTDTEKANIVNAILTEGFVVQCRTEGTIIAGIQAYQQYVTSAQGGCLCYMPCVIS